MSAAMAAARAEGAEVGSNSRRRRILDLGASVIAGGLGACARVFKVDLGGGGFGGGQGAAEVVEHDRVVGASQVGVDRGAVTGDAVAVGRAVNLGVAGGCVGELV